MPDEATSPTAGMAQPAGAGGGAAGQPAQAPMGVSSVTGPTPNKGFEAQAVQRLGGIASLLHETLPMVGYNSELGKAIGNLLDKIVKLLPSGNQDQQAQKNMWQSQMQKQAQQAQMAQSLKQPPQQAPGQTPGGPPMPKMAA